MKKKRILVVGDAVAPTGFSTVLHNILGNLSKKEFEIHHLGINYRGDPHDFDWKIYPAFLGNDLMGFNRLEQFSQMELNGIFFLNDVWVISKYLQIIKEKFSNIPPIVVYFPVDSLDLDIEFFKNFDIVSKTVVYTDFARKEVIKSSQIESLVIPHGIDSSIFYRINETRHDAKKVIFGDNEDLIDDSFVVLNANRNQPRKRVDITIQGFALFAKGKPENVKLYLHMGMKDAGWDLFKLCKRYDIDNRLILSNTNPNIQSISLDKLNLIYNASDVGLNTCMGEGWSLTNMEHAVTGAPQIVPDHSVLPEIYGDCGLLIPVSMWLHNQDTLTISGFVHPKDVAEKLEEIYSDKELYNKLSERAYEKFTDTTYNWKNIVEERWIPLFREVFK